MKFLLLTFFTLVSLAEGNCQYAKLIVQFVDKRNNTFSLNDPSKFLSQRAINRRNRYQIPIDSTDLPVTKQFIDSLSGTGEVKILSTSRWLNQVLIETTDLAALDKIRSFSFVKSAKPIGFRSVNNNNRIDKLDIHPVAVAGSNAHRASGTNTDSYNYGDNYNQVHIHEGEFLHNKGFHGETIQVAVLDAGFRQYKSITAFDSIRMNGQVLGERDFVAFDSSVNEDDPHGMYCLSILSANWPGRMIGTAPKARYWLIRTENAASEYPIEEHNWVVGAEFADSAGCDIISSSLGYYDFDDSTFNHHYTDFYKNSTMISQGAAWAVRKGMIVSNSAGNEGGNNWKYIIFPADVDSVCTVGAVNAQGVIAGFSSIGYKGKVKPDVVSVGENTVIAGLDNQPEAGSGTSFSNPNIAGLIGCLWQAFPSFNNMKILDAVYRSADKYQTPDNRYGFGIPNFRIAYRLLKHDQNVATYGTEWLFATPDPFINKIDVKLIGRKDGPAKIELINAAGQIVASDNIVTEEEEISEITFTNLDNVLAGLYTVKYADSTTTTSVSLQKGNIFSKDWLVVLPNPFRDYLVASLKAPETGEVSLRLIDAKGSVIETVKTNVTQNEIQTIRFANKLNLSAGLYLLEYRSKTQRRIISLLKR